MLRNSNKAICQCELKLPKQTLMLAFDVQTIAHANLLLKVRVELPHLPLLPFPSKLQNLHCPILLPITGMLLHFRTIFDMMTSLFRSGDRRSQKIRD
mmetsp:Transcript_28499/g.57480  ORF Transcript_28499/g.57480 Transcript_28499/m.57480 type:complete len:97 (-) Transcript_28499:46-336(-)